MKEVKLSPKERMLLAALYESEQYKLGLRPILERAANAYVHSAAMSAQDMGTVMRLRGKAEMLKDLHSYLKNIDSGSKKKRRETNK